jgi:hypothetical protein
MFVLIIQRPAVRPEVRFAELKGWSSGWSLEGVLFSWPPTSLKLDGRERIRTFDVLFVGQTL